MLRPNGLSGYDKASIVRLLGVCWGLVCPASLYALENTDCGQVTRQTPVEASHQPLPSVEMQTCLISLADIKGATFVDVRPEKNARDLRLPHALQIPRAELRTKTFLKREPLVLVGSGKNDVELASACIDLKKTGFIKLNVLAGGLRTWQAGGKELVGDARALNEIYFVSASEAHSLAAAKATIVLTGEKKDSKQEQAIALLKTNITYARDVPELRTKASEPYLPLVIAPADQLEADKWLSMIKEAGLTKVVILRGGLAAYKRFLAEQESIQANANLPLIRPCNVIGSNS